MRKIIFILLLILVSSSVMADMGPKPSAIFSVVIDGVDVSSELNSLRDAENIRTVKVRIPFSENNLTHRYHTIKQVINESDPDYIENNTISMLSCAKQRNPAYKDISSYNITGNYKRDDEPMFLDVPCEWEVYDMAWFRECISDGCEFHYRIPSKFKVAIVYKNTTYLTSMMVHKSRDATYDIKINNGAVDIVDTTFFFTVQRFIGFLIALGITLFLELIVALLFIYVLKWPYSLLRTIVAVNLMSLPILWFVFPLFFGVLSAFILGEIFVFFFEYYIICKKYDFSRSKIFLMVLIMNLLSMFIGGFIGLLFWN